MPRGPCQVRRLQDSIAEELEQLERHPAPHAMANADLQVRR